MQQATWVYAHDLVYQTPSSSFDIIIIRVEKRNRKRGGEITMQCPPLEVARDLPRSDLVRRFTSEFPKVVLSRETSSKISRVPRPLEEAFSSFIDPSRLCPPKSDFDQQDGFKKVFLVLLRTFFGPLEGMFRPSCAILEP